MKRRLPTLAILACSAAGCVVEPAPNVNTQSVVRDVGPVATPGAIKAAVTLQAYTDAAARSLVPEMQEALQKVEGDARRLLALRAYLRGGRDLGAKWAWSQQRIDAYRNSAEYAAAVAEVEKVKGKFAELNPGYTLHVNTEVRSLDEQVRNWNEADSVRRAGEELLTAAAKELSSESYEPTPDKAELERFERFLRGYSPVQSPSVAAPGLSAQASFGPSTFR